MIRLRNALALSLVVTPIAVPADKLPPELALITANGGEPVTFDKD